MKNHPSISLPSLRRWLISIHRDLLAIDRRIDRYAVNYPEGLTTFEKVVLTLEDRRFFRHAGVDKIAIGRVLWRLATFRRPGGASTIDMQLARVSTGRFERTIRRKIREMMLARFMQYRYAKVAILRSYLAIAYFGYRLTGADAASFSLYGKSTEQLDETEAALVASLLVFPMPKHPTELWERKRLRRSNYILSVYVRRKQKFDKLEI